MKADFEWYNRLNRREQTLLVLVGGTVFILLQIFLFNFVVNNYTRLQAALKTGREQFETAQLLISEKEKWATREAWLTANQPELTNESGANVQLMSQLQNLAKENGVLIQEPEVHPVTNEENYSSVSISIATTSSWEALVRFLYAVKQAESFIVIQSLQLETEPKDPAQMRGRFTIAKWYRPR